MILLRRLFWRLIAIVSLKLAVLGIPLPGLPTVPFVLLAAWAAGKGWPELENWLLRHPRYGPSILAWRREGAVSRKAKWIATGMMAVSLVMLFWSPAPVLLKYLLPPFLAAVAFWLWRRPEPVAQSSPTNPE
ncbi:MAG: YbaN family protein [Aliidiomarina sp.]|uniref:YbaN family protein n=1 Tax=Aliidiomarina sp. TaxID=1872439 RepID=UPI0025B8C65A|nr:YbaN family protein [Aliidiomarina sp.]MCH8501134.1 YbaN family protein [Aliidiomarina sp.]